MNPIHKILGHDISKNRNISKITYKYYCMKCKDFFTVHGTDFYMLHNKSVSCPQCGSKKDVILENHPYVNLNI